MGVKKLLLMALGLGLLTNLFMSYEDLEIFDDYGSYKMYSQQGKLQAHQHLERQFSNETLRSLTDFAYKHRPEQDVYYLILYIVFGSVLLFQYRKYYLQNKEHVAKNIGVFLLLALLAMVGWALGAAYMISAGLVDSGCIC